MTFRNRTSLDGIWQFQIDPNDNNSLEIDGGAVITKNQSEALHRCHYMHQDLTKEQALQLNQSLEQNSQTAVHAADDLFKAAQVGRADPFDGRNRAVKHVIETAILAGALDRGVRIPARATAPARHAFHQYVLRVPAAQRDPLHLPRARQRRQRRP